jgi:CHAD domain-containing protein
VEAWCKPVDEFAKQALEDRLRVLWAEMERCAAGADADPVHDLRVAIRRFSQALRIFGALYGRKASRKARQRLTTVMDAAAAVRDLDVGMERLIEEGLPADSAVIGQMRRERMLKSHSLLGHIHLLRGEDPLPGWREKLGLAP